MKWLDRFPRLQLIGFTILVLFLVMFFDERQSFSLVLYKLSLASAAAVLGIWIHKLTFGGDAVDQMSRTLLMGACILGVCMGL